jgi:hypothetical protein
VKRVDSDHTPNPFQYLFQAAVTALLLLSACTARSEGEATRHLSIEGSGSDERAVELRGRLDFHSPPSIRDLATGKVEPPEPGELGDELKTATHRWFYGKGVGSTLANVGTIVVFPPYAFYLLGNAALEMGGYQPLHITNALPEEPRKEVLGIYNRVVSAPGRFNALVAGEEFQ